MKRSPLFEQLIPVELDAFEAFLAERYDWLYFTSRDWRISDIGQKAAAALHAFMSTSMATPDHKRAYNRQHSVVFGDQPNYRAPFPEVERALELANADTKN